MKAITKQKVPVRETEHTLSLNLSFIQSPIPLIIRSIEMSEKENERERKLERERERESERVKSGNHIEYSMTGSLHYYFFLSRFVLCLLTVTTQFLVQAPSWYLSLLSSIFLLSLSHSRFSCEHVFY